MADDSSPAQVERACLEAYRALPPTGKPSKREWTVLAGVVLRHGRGGDGGRGGEDGRRLEVVALGTGTKCLTASAAEADATGLRVRDGHAEVSARRAFRRYLCAELRALFDGAPSVLERAGESGRGDGAGLEEGPRGGEHGECAPYRLRPSITVVFFTSASPCGDASLFVRAAEPPEADANTEARDEAGRAKRPRLPARDAAGASAPAGQPCDGPSLAAVIARTPGATMPGAVQRKPGRGESTRSVSCSDKLARWAALGLQGAALSHWLLPVRADVLVVAGAACARALGRALLDRLPNAGPDRGAAGGEPDGCADERGGPAPRAMRLVAMRSAAASAGEGPPADEGAQLAAALGIAYDTQRPPAACSPCSNSVNWSAVLPLPAGSEAVNGLSGLKLGANKGKLSRRHGSRLSKRAFLEEFSELCARAPAGALPSALAGCGLAAGASEGAGGAGITYRQLKQRASAYQGAKRRVLRADGPLGGWTGSPPELEDFASGRRT